MSDHENVAGEQKTDLRIAALAFAFPPLFIVFFAIAIVTYSGMFGARRANADEEAVAARILPVARVELAAGTGGAKGAKSGEEVVNGACGACHTAGVAGAPKIGDKAAWAPRLAQGLDAMVKSATAGKNAMPPKGGADVTPLELTRAVVFMANKSGASFKEPAEKK
jgi:cytochrome c5